MLEAWMRRVLPVAVAVVVLAGLAAGLYIANRQPPIPTSTSSMPAVGSCWNVASAAEPLPWSGSPVACTGNHTAEIFYTGQVDKSLIQDFRNAKAGQETAAAALLMEGEARAGCAGHAAAYLGGSWRGAQMTIAPDFVGSPRDGFFACAAAQVSDPSGTKLVVRTATLKGALASGGTLGIDCYTADATGALSFVPCAVRHIGEYVGLYTVTPLGAPYDGPELKSAVTTGCQAILNGFLGLPSGASNRSDLQSSFVGPTTSSTWLGSDQSFACFATAASPIVGTVKGLGARPLPH
jgi:hypothetical protein